MIPSRVVASVAFVVLSAGSARAQDSAISRFRLPTVPLQTLGSIREDDWRLRQIAGLAPTAGWLIRTPMLVTPSLEALGVPARSFGRCQLRTAAITPLADLTWNSQIPFERNDGAVWSGRGATLHGLAGVRAECGRLRVQFAPEVWYAQNRPFSLIGVEVVGRSAYTNPFFSGTGWSSDIPVRFGNQPLLIVDPGQSAVELDVWRATLGLGTESQWWGPAIRNALVMSNHAAGIPNAYLRTRRPVGTPLGQVEGRWTVGILTESPFFDFEPENNVRSFTGIVTSLRTGVDSNLTVGAAVVVYGLLGNTVSVAAHVLDPITRLDEGPNPSFPGITSFDQMFSLFGRWIFPQSGFETYAEWARTVPPKSLRSFLVAPQFAQGYTLGFQWLSNITNLRDAWRIQGELTDLEQPYQSRSLSPPTYYVSSNVPQGYTQRGQVVGAMIGPGSSSQWLAVDRYRGDKRLGAFIARIRWQNDAFYRAPTGLSAFAHDLSLIAGLRGARRVGRFEVTAEIAAEQRLNYLFQSATIGYVSDGTFDVNNLNIRFGVEPRSWF